MNTAMSNRIVPVGRLGDGTIDKMIASISPEHPWAFILGGAVIIGISSSDQFENTPAQFVMRSIGGVVLVLGALPVLLEFLKGFTPASK